MTLLDAGALLALLGDEPAAPVVNEILREPEVAILSVNLTEVVDVAVRRWGSPRAAVNGAIELLLAAGLRVIAADREIALLGADVRVRRYSSRVPLSLADCLLLGAALSTDAAVASTDRLLVDTAVAEGIRVRRLRGPSS